MDMVVSPFHMVTEGEMDLSVYHVRVAKNVDADIHCG